MRLDLKFENIQLINGDLELSYDPLFAFFTWIFVNQIRIWDHIWFLNFAVSTFGVLIAVRGGVL